MTRCLNRARASPRPTLSRAATWRPAPTPPFGTRFPGTGDAHDTFFQTDVMQDFSHAVVSEGECPVEFADVTAFVAPATGGRLLVRRKSDQPSKDKAAMDALEAVLSQPRGLEAILARLISPALGEFARQQPDWSSRSDAKFSPSWPSCAASRCPNIR
jgi:hypothetical protein